MKFQLLVIALTIALISLTFISAPFPQELVLQHCGTLLGIGILAAFTFSVSLTNLSFACGIAFLWLHILGARWIYSYVPYDDWAVTLTGTSLSDLFGWQRNHYDRLVHFASGLLGVAPAAELLQKLGGMRPLGAAFMGAISVLAIGALYEIFEWQIAVRFSPDQAEAYNGQQGDVWDPQKDLALAGAGALLAALFLFRWAPTKIDHSDLS